MPTRTRTVPAVLVADICKNVNLPGESHSVIISNIPRCSEPVVPMTYDITTCVIPSIAKYLKRSSVVARTSGTGVLIAVSSSTPSMRGSRVGSTTSRAASARILATWASGESSSEKSAVPARVWSILFTTTAVFRALKNLQSSWLREVQLVVWRDVCEEPGGARLRLTSQ